MPIKNLFLGELMELVKASNEEHWVLASKFLTQAVERCNRNETPLWTYDQVKVTSLKNHIPLHNYISFDTNKYLSDVSLLVLIAMLFGKILKVTAVYSFIN